MFTLVSELFLSIMHMSFHLCKKEVPFSILRVVNMEITYFKIKQELNIKFLGNLHVDCS